MLSTLVGILMGPFTLRLLSLAPFTRSQQIVHEHHDTHTNKHQIKVHAEIY